MTLAPSAMPFKRLSPFEEELMLLDPHHMKRARLLHGLADDVALPVEVEQALAVAVAAATTSNASSASSSDTASLRVSRRRQHDDMEDDSEPDAACLGSADKRRRQLGTNSDHIPESENGNVSPAIQSRAEVIVKDLHGCPSVEEAMRRCAKRLGEFASEVSAATLREADPSCAPSSGQPPEASTSAATAHAQEVKVFRRAVFHLAERCRRFEACAQEATALRQALDQSEEARRRLNHSNEVLREHMRVHLDGCRFQDGW